jgi:antitoxin (DNA-binding transcriptional repressor) of toxin-antitoxin stability system
MRNAENFDAQCLFAADVAAILYTECVHPGHDMPETKSVNFRELRENLSDVLRQASMGAEFTVISRGKVLARIGPPPHSGGRPIGLLKGRIVMAEDFDETPDDILNAMESGDV